MSLSFALWRCLLYGIILFFFVNQCTDSEAFFEEFYWIKPSKENRNKKKQKNSFKKIFGNTRAAYESPTVMQDSTIAVTQRVETVTIGSRTTVAFSLFRRTNGSPDIFSFIEMEVIKCDESRSLKIKKAESTSEYLFFWLRDHCRCDFCYNHLTSQRKINVTDIPMEIKPKEVLIEESTLKVIWEDGHQSKYSIAALENLEYKNYVKKMERNYILWTKKEIQNLPVCHVNYSELLNTEEGVRNVIKSLVDYGVAFLENVPSDITSTEKAILRLSHVQHTLFGGMWQFSDSMDHSDTAYTTEELGAHTDNTYFTEAAGLQVLHCINHSGTGGDSLLVDGFKALEILKKTDPEVYERLTTVCIEAEYLEPGYHHTYCAPVIKLNSVTRQPEQIRFNVHDRAPVSLPYEEILQHYKDYRLLGSIIKNPDLEWRFKLNPGTVMIFDNFRVLHGRSSYTGHRTMCGCYIGRGDFLSKARVLNII